MGELARIVIMGITLLSIQAVVKAAMNHTSKESDGTEQCFVVKPPSSLNPLYIFADVVGLVTLIAFTISALNNNPTVTTGHFVVSLTVIVLGLLMQLWINRFSIVVNGENLTINRLFKKQITIKVTEIDKILTDRKGQVRVYRLGRKLVTVSPLCDNYELFIKFIK